ncbi:MAG: cytochrome B [Rhizobiales bacterium]|nr:cytochrome B [Hyphomicrobiales bacterium]
MTDTPQAQIKVWDIFIRIFHWTLVVAFSIAFFTEGDPFWLHTSAGFVVAGLVAARLVWGVVGPEHARFKNFAYGPRAVFGYLFDLIRFRSSRYLGHSPAGGAMVIALMIGLVGTTASGITMYFTHEEPDIRSESVMSADVMHIEQGDEDAHDDGKEHEESFIVEVHDVLGHLTFFLVLFHIAGVTLASFAHHENLSRAMITGMKRP